MKRILYLLSAVVFSTFSAQKIKTVQDSINPQKPLLNLENQKFLKDIHVYLDMRLGFLNHFENGRTDNFTEFRNSLVALGVQGKIHDKVNFRFRYRFNKNGEVQSLDMLDKAVELAFVDVKILPKTNLQVGKMYAYFGGYEYDYNPIDILEYNDAINQLLNYVSGVGITQQISEQHKIGFQALNSRTMRYADLYEGNVYDNVQEPKWPLALVLNWQGKFFDNKLETIYSMSNFRVAKGHASTYAFSLGHKYQVENLKVMYDFNYSHEQLDTKGILTEMIKGPKISEDATYIENWFRAEYQISPKIQTLLTLMTSNTYGKNVVSTTSGNNHLRTSYGIVPTVYYQPFKDIKLRFYLAYIARIYRFSDYARNQLGISNYTTGEVQVGLSTPLWIF